jgi:peptidyl-prolyl cis-trans isomerase SurA
MRASWIVLLAAALARPGVAEPELINGVAAIVNDAVITRQEVWQLAGPDLERLKRVFDDMPQVLQQKRTKLEQDAVELLVERQLILHDYRTAGYNMPESIIDDEIRRRIKERYRDRATCIKSLKLEGISFETFRQQMHDMVIVEAMRNFHVSKELIISPQKLINYYEANKTNYAVADQIKLRTIVLNKPAGAGADTNVTKELAQEILAKIKGGASFEEMARIHSDGSQRAVGGDWGWVERSVPRKELADAAFSLKKGALSEVLDLPEACFIILVEDIRTAHVKPLTAVRDEIEKILVMQERARLQEKWVERLKTKSFVRYF